MLDFLFQGTFAEIVKIRIKAKVLIVEFSILAVSSLSAGLADVGCGGFGYGCILPKPCVVRTITGLPNVRQRKQRLAATKDVRMAV